MTTRRPRVVFLGHSAQPSGAELGLLRLVRAMTRYEPIVVLAEDGPLVGQLRGSGVRCEVAILDRSVADVRHSQIRPGRDVISAAQRAYVYGRNLGGLLRSLSPDIVDTFTLKAHVLGRIAQRGTSVPRIAHVHDRVAREYMRPPSIALMRVVLGRCDGLVFNSTSTASTVPSLRRGQDRIVVGSAIDEPARRAGRPTRDGAHTFGCVGRLTPWKGQDLALRALADLCSRFPDRDLRMRFVGGAFFGEDAYVARLRSLAVDLAISDRVDWVGHVDDVYNELCRIDTLVHCSTIPEPFGQVIVEGMAFGVPVVAGDEGGPADLVADGETGLAFAPRDVMSLAGAMRRAMTLSDEQRDGMTARARATASRYYAVRVAERVESFYDRVRAGGDEIVATRSGESMPDRSKLLRVVDEFGPDE